MHWIKKDNNLLPEVWVAAAAEGKMTILGLECLVGNNAGMTRAPPAWYNSWTTELSYLFHNIVWMRSRLLAGPVKKKGVPLIQQDTILHNRVVNEMIKPDIYGNFISLGLIWHGSASGSGKKPSTRFSCPDFYILRMRCYLRCSYSAMTGQEIIPF